jgi:arylsulfatase A-like enzyme
MPYARRFLKGMIHPWWRTNLDPDRYMAGAVQMSKAEMDVLTALYDSRLASTDAMVGQLIEYLRRENILDETLIIIVADHGENLGEHGLMSHQYCVYDTLAHVPLIIRYPPLFPAGQRVPDQVQTLELFTTIMDILAVDQSKVPNDVHGRSLIPEKLALHPLPFAVSEYLVANLARMRRLFPDHDIDRYDRGLRAIRRDDWKAIFASDGDIELYNLAIDPQETLNLAVQRPDLVREIQAQLNDWLASVGMASTGPAGKDEEADLDPVVVKRLQDLGYF